MATSRSIRRRHECWLQRAAFGTRRWRAECRCTWHGEARRYEWRAWADGLAHSEPLNIKHRLAA